MTQSFLYDGDNLARVRHTTVQLTEQAELGGVGNGRLIVNDKAGTLAIVGQKDFAADQDDCTNPVLFRGFIADQEYKRGPESQGPSREIEITVGDLNSMLAFLVFSGTSAAEGDRPAETVDERLEWLIDWLADNMPGLFVGTRIGSSDHGMNETNYQDQHPSDVLAGVILAAESWNYYVRDFGTGDGPELVCRNDNTSTADTTSLVISNVPGEADFTTTFPPFKDFVLSKRPGRVGSKVRFSYAKSVIEETRPATAAAFNGERDLTATDSSITDAAVAHVRAKSLLWQHHTEERVIEGTILLPPEAVNLACQGDRIGVRLQHLTPEGFYDVDDLVYCRILERTVRPLLKPTRLYESRIRLSPQEAGPSAGAIVQHAFAKGTHFGLTFGFPNPVTPGNHLVAMIGTKLGDGDEPPPNTEASLPRLGAGAWTRFNGSTLTRAGAVPTSPYTNNACAAYWKVADSIEQSCYFPINGGVVGIWELAGADPAAAAIDDEDRATGGADYTIGSVGSPAAGDIALAIWVLGNRGASGDWSWDYANSYPWQTPDPVPGIAAGWDIGISKWAGGDNWSLDAYLPGTPWVIIAEAEGTGAALPATVTPGQSAHIFGGIALVIPPA